MLDSPLPHPISSSRREMTRDLILGQSFLSKGIVSPSFVQHLLREHETGRRDNQTWLWSLLVLAMWLEDTRDARLPLPPAEPLAGAART